MIGTSLVANKIYKALQPHEDSVRHIEALALWNRPVFSGILLFIVEFLFFLFHWLPFNKSCILCLIIGSVIFLSALHDAIPSLFGIIKAFQIYPTAPLAPNRVRSVKEISAYLTTILSVWTTFVSLVYTSIATVSLRNVVLSCATFLLVLMLVWVIGDFWFIWAWFHIIFVCPGVVALPTVQAWIAAAAEEDDGARDTSGDEGHGGGDEAHDGGDEAEPQ